MKKLTLMIVLVVGSISVLPNDAAAQFVAGDKVIGLHAGLGSGYGVAGRVGPSPVFTLTYDHATSFNVGPGVLGIGGLVGYSTIRAENRHLFITYDYRYNYLTFGVRGSYHYNDWHNNPDFDTYGGVMASFSAVSTSGGPEGTVVGYTTPRSRSRAYGSAFVGARYYVADSFGFVAEFSSAISHVSFGLVFKF